MCAQQISTNTFGTARFIVSPTASQGTHTTIQSAIDDASSGDTVVILPAVYTENPECKAGVNLIGMPSSQSGTQVLINGTLSFGETGIVSISNVLFTATGVSAIELSGNNASTLALTDCYITMGNEVAIAFDNTNASSNLLMNTCYCDATGAGAALFHLDGPGSLILQYCFIRNTGNSITYNDATNGNVIIQHCEIYQPIQTTVEGVIQSSHSSYYTSAISQTAWDLAGTGSSSSLQDVFYSGTAAAATVGAGCTLEMYEAVINSSNAAVLSGLGTLAYGGITFNNGSTITVSTANPIAFPVAEGGSGAITLTGVLTGNGTSAFTASTVTENGIVLGGTSNAVTSLAEATDGQLPIGSTGSPPSLATITAGSNISVTNGAGSITIDANTQDQVVSYIPVTDNDSPYTVLSTDYYIGCTSGSGAITLLFPNAPDTGRIFVVKDANGAAGTYNITITTVGGAVTIDGATTYVLQTDYSSVQLIFNGASYEVF